MPHVTRRGDQNATPPITKYSMSHLQLVVLVFGLQGTLLLGVNTAWAFVGRKTTIRVRGRHGVPPPSAPTLTLASLNAVSRRHVLESSAAAAAVSVSSSSSRRVPFSVSSSTAVAAEVSSSSNSNLVADLKMIRLRLPKGGFGREYLAVPLMVQGKGPFEFMVDTGLTTELITPHLQRVLRNRTSGKIQGISAGGSSLNTLIELKDVRLPTGETLPTLHAVVTDFPQEHIDPAHDPIEGMIGMEALSLFDVDFDFPKNRLRLYKPGTAPTTGLIEIPAAVINDTGLIGIRIKSTETQQPILGFLDCGAAFSVVNLAAAPLLGLVPTNPINDSPRKGPTVAGIGIDGRPFPMPTVSTSLTFAGNVQIDPKTGKPIGFEPPPNTWRPWSPIDIGVGDIPAFSTILGDGQTPYRGPAALLGLDILTQRRLILATAPEGSASRQRSVWVSPQ